MAWRDWLPIPARTTKTDSTPANPGDWFIDWLHQGHATRSGINVNADSAMRLAAVWSCVRIRSEDLGKLPCVLYKRLPDGGKQKATDHPAFTLLRDQPNPFQTAFEFKQLLQAWIDTRGNGYALKETDARGRLVALWPLNPTWVQVLRVPGTFELFYRLTIPNQPIDTVPAEAILHVRGLSLDGFSGVSPIAYHRETIGLGLAAQEYGAAFFGNSAQPNGALKVPHVLGKEAADILRTSWEEKYRGVENAKKIAIFDGGMEWIQTGMDNTDAQYLETRKFQKTEIYGLYRIPPHKAGDLEKSTNNNIEQQALEYVTDCLLTEFVRWEQALKRDLLSDSEKETYFFEFMPDSLLRGDFASRMAGYSVARNWGILSVNEIRDRENLNRIGDNGDIYLQPLNMVEAGKPGNLAVAAGEAASAAAAEAKKASEALFFELRVMNAARAEVDASRRAELLAVNERIEIVQQMLSLIAAKDPTINVKVDAPEVNVEMPTQTINVPERDVNLSVNNLAAEMETEVTEHTKDGRIKKFKQRRLKKPDAKLPV